MVPGNFQRRSSTCLLARAFEAVVVRQDGFEWRNERPSMLEGGEEQLASEKWGWISDKPGSWAEMTVDTTSDLEVGGCQPVGGWVGGWVAGQLASPALAAVRASMDAAHLTHPALQWLTCLPAPAGWTRDNEQRGFGQLPQVV